MPKVNSYTTKEDGIRAWIAVGLVTSGVKTRKELARRIGMPLSTFTTRYAHPEDFRIGELWKIERVIGSKYEGK